MCPDMPYFARCRFFFPFFFGGGAFFFFAYLMCFLDCTYLEGQLICSEMLMKEIKDYKVIRVAVITTKALNENLLQMRYYV